MIKANTEKGFAETLHSKSDTNVLLYISLKARHKAFTLHITTHMCMCGIYVFVEHVFMGVSVYGCMYVCTHMHAHVENSRNIFNGK